MVNLVNSIDTTKFIVHICCIRDVGEFQSRIKNEETKIIECKFAEKNWDICCEIQKLCKEMSIDIVHTHGWGTFFVGVLGAKMARVPIVINGEHGTLYYETFKRRLIQSILFNWVDLNLTVSIDLKLDILKRFWVTNSKFYTILNGVDTNKFRPNEEVRQEKRNELGIDQDTYIVGTVGRLAPIKDYPTLLRAFAILKEREKERKIKLIIVGEGEERSKLESLAKKLKIEAELLMLGYRKDIPELLNTMDIFVLTSEKEGLSNTILEAMACGKPVLATNVGGNPELVQHELTGILFPFRDYMKLAEYFTLFYKKDSLLKYYSRNAMLTAQQKFSLREMVKKYENVYFKLIGEKIC
ncbi:L-malate glycosyltransferase [Candidatus Magnetomoraceae bacterium gMMP-15]